MSKGLSILFFSLCSFCGIAQSKSLAALFGDLKNAKHDTTFYTVYIDIGKCYQKFNADSALYYHVKAKVYADKIKDDLMMGEAARLIGVDYFFKRDYDKALISLNEVLAIIARAVKTKGKVSFSKLKELKAACIGNIGTIYFSQDHFNKALDHYFMAIKLSEEIGDHKLKAKNEGNVGLVYTKLGNYAKALEYNFMALKTNEEIGDNPAQALNLGNIGLVYHYQKDYSKILAYYFKALQIDEEIGNKNGISRHLGNIGGAYQMLNNNAEAVKYYFKAIKIDEELGNKSGIESHLGNLGVICTLQADSAIKKGNKLYAYKVKYPRALKYYFEALKMSDQINYKQGQIVNSGNIGSLYTILKNYNLAEKYIQQSYQMANEIGSLDDIKKAHQYFTEVYSINNKEALALKHYKLFIQFRDSLNNKENLKANIQQEMKFNYEKKAAADSVKTAQNQKVSRAKLKASEALLKQQKTTRMALYGGLALVILFAGFMVNRFRVVNRQKKLIVEQKKIVDEQKLIVEEKQKEIIDSINYAKRIQTALLTNEKYIERVINKLQKK